MFIDLPLAEGLTSAHILWQFQKFHRYCTVAATAKEDLSVDSVLSFEKGGVEPAPFAGSKRYCIF